MENNYLYPARVQDVSIVRTVDTSQLVPARRHPSFLSMITGKDTLDLEVAHEEAVEHGRAKLAATALKNTAALSSLEEHLNTVAPSGSARYRAIVDSYAYSSAIQIARF